MVILQSLWIGGLGVVLGCLAALMLARGAEAVGVKLMLPYWLVLPACFGTMLAALVAGLFALRSVRLIEPVELLR
jgi:ABC-type antimicrobial peptide transport system permease subunit